MAGDAKIDLNNILAQLRAVEEGLANGTFKWVDEKSTLQVGESGLPVDVTIHTKFAPVEPEPERGADPNDSPTVLPDGSDPDNADSSSPFPGGTFDPADLHKIISANVNALPEGEGTPGVDGVQSDDPTQKRIINGKPVEFVDLTPPLRLGLDANTQTWLVDGEEIQVVRVFKVGDERLENNNGTQTFQDINTGQILALAPDPNASSLALLSNGPELGGGPEIVGDDDFKAFMNQFPDIYLAFSSAAPGSGHQPFADHNFADPGGSTPKNTEAGSPAVFDPVSTPGDALLTGTGPIKTF